MTPLTAEKIAELAKQWRSTAEDPKFPDEDLRDRLEAEDETFLRCAEQLEALLPELISELSRLMAIEERVRAAPVGFVKRDRGYMRSHRFIIGADHLTEGKRVALVEIVGGEEGNG
jgi:hypothetical protein